MRVKMIDNLATERLTFQLGKTYDLDDVEATEYIAAGIAVEAPPDTGDTEGEGPTDADADPAKPKKRKK